MTTSAAHSMLPTLSPDERRHSEAVREMIMGELEAAGGWLSFEQFMELALYAPGLGYYSAGSVKIGAGGDFVTAPEISDLFSRCVARQCAQVLNCTGGEILELGAGTGRMAGTILTALAQIGCLPQRYAILEVSADLAQRQRQHLQSLPQQLRERVVWVQQLESPVRGVILANEVLDALPFERFMVRDGRAIELGVSVAGGQLCWSERDEASGLASAGEAGYGNGIGALGAVISDLPDGYVSEVCNRVESWIGGVGDSLERGALLLFDYGLPRAHYYHPDRTSGTLRCHFKHLAHDNPFINLGVQDITAWVDFTRVAESALATGLEVSGFATQAGFLLGTGIEAMISQPRTEVERVRFAGEARRLLMPEEMGETFKAIALTRDFAAPLEGFAFQDLRDSL